MEWEILPTSLSLFHLAGSFSASPQLGYHSHTPAADFAAGIDEKGKGYWRNSYGSIDKDAAEIGAAAGA